MAHFYAMEGPLKSHTRPGTAFVGGQCTSIVKLCVFLLTFPSNPNENVVIWIPYRDEYKLSSIVC